jgi:hypothetical protein
VIELAEWLDHDGLQHAWHPATDGERTSWCGLTVPADVPTEGSATLCMRCVVSHGSVVADQQGANIYRTPDPEGPCGDD